jgi:DNA polymerase
MDPALRRKARQMLEIDQFLGLDAVPINDIEVTVEFDEPVAVAAEAPTPLAAAAAARPAFTPQPQPTAPAPRTLQPTTSVSPTMPRASAPPRDETPFPPCTLTADQKRAALAALEAEHNAACPHCSPQRDKLKMVFADGNPCADIMFIGEGPGEEEDRQGLPFVGKAGQLLNKQIAAMGLRREDVYIANIVKTRPPNNRVPTPEEAELCMPYLVRQIEIVHPKAIVALGATATKYLFNDLSIAITKERGRWKTYRGIDVMPTFHPAFLLRSYTPENRARVWDDLKKVLERVGLPVPSPRKTE